MRLSVRITPPRELAETFTIARGSTDIEQVVARRAPSTTASSATARARRSTTTARRADVDARVHRASRRRDRSATTRSRSRRSSARLAATPAGTGAKCGARRRAARPGSASVVGQPIWRLLGARPTRTPQTSYTIGIDTVEGTADRARRAAEAGFAVLKVKVGGADDLERLRAIRAGCDLPPARRRQRGLDARDGRGAAAGPRRARRRADRAAVPGGDLDELPRAARAVGSASRWSSTRAATTSRPSPPSRATPTASTSSSRRRGGIREAVRMIHAARALGLVRHARLHDRELGSASRRPRRSRRSCDFVDLDGHLLSADDPSAGSGFEDGRDRALRRPRASASRRA